MRTTISFINTKGNFLMTLESDVNPIDTYKIGDKINLDIDTIIFPKTKSDLLLKYKQEFVDSIIESYEEDIKKLNKRFKIISKNQYIKRSINFVWEYSQVIEYTVKENEKFYFKWWYIKHLLKTTITKLKLVK